MTRRKKLHALALALLLLTTVPVLALLCRGHSPSRFAAANLPYWERQLPTPAPVRMRYRFTPAAPASVRLSGDPLLKALLKSDEDELFAGLEHPVRSHGADAGKAGAWLEAACALGREDARLRTKQDRVAIRLMNNQDADGFLGVGPRVPAWSERDLSAHEANMRGLLAYYDLTHNPAAIYAAMAAGDLLLSERDTSPGRPADAGEGELAIPMARLYQASSEAKYLAFAARAAQTAPQDGLSLCALYQATGQRHYLTDAQALAEYGCAASPRAVELDAQLLLLTGSPRYTAALCDASVTACWLPSVVCTRAPGGLALHDYTNAEATFGPVHLTEHVQNGPLTPNNGEIREKAPFPVPRYRGGGDIVGGGGLPAPDSMLRRQITVVVKVSRPTKFTLRLFVPVDTAHLSINYAKAAPAPAGHYLALTRRWKSGDRIALCA